MYEGELLQLPMSLEENLKKAITELLVLFMLSKRECYIGELTEMISEKSLGVLNVVFPYAAIYRMLDDECISEVKKRIAPDGRRRQYYKITDKGRIYLDMLIETYLRFSQGVTDILADGGQQK